MGLNVVVTCAPAQAPAAEPNGGCFDFQSAPAHHERLHDLHDPRDVTFTPRAMPGKHRA